jgi:hypothetical protein
MPGKLAEFRVQPGTDGKPRRGIGRTFCSELRCTSPVKAAARYLPVFSHYWPNGQTADSGKSFKAQLNGYRWWRTFTNLAALGRSTANDLVHHR